MIVRIVVAPRSFSPWIVTDGELSGSWARTHAQRRVRQLIDYLKANPGKVNVGSPGAGSMSNMAAELFRARTGLKYTLVPYRGGAQGGQDVAAGNTQMMFSAALEAKPFLESRKTRAIAITRRLDAAPNRKLPLQILLKNHHRRERINTHLPRIFHLTPRFRRIPGRTGRHTIPPRHSPHRWVRRRTKTPPALFLQQPLRFPTRQSLIHHLHRHTNLFPHPLRKPRCLLGHPV